MIIIIVISQPRSCSSSSVGEMGEKGVSLSFFRRRRSRVASSRRAGGGIESHNGDEPVLGEPLPGGHSSYEMAAIFIQRDNLLLS